MAALTSDAGRSPGERSRPSPLLLAATLGGLSGARTAAGPALFTWSSRKAWPLRAAAAGFAAFEMAADTIPWIGDRVSPSQLAARAVSGALVGGAVAARAGRRRIGPALLGAASAVVSAGITFLLRRASARRLGWIAGLAEDAAVYGLGSLAVSRLR